MRGNSHNQTNKRTSNDANKTYRELDKRLGTLERLVTVQAEQISKLLPTVSTLVQQKIGMLSP